MGNDSNCDRPQTWQGGAGEWTGRRSVSENAEMGQTMDAGVWGSEKSSSEWAKYLAVLIRYVAFS